MDQSKEILNFLDERAIPYLIYRHEPLFTIEACQQIEGIDWQTSAMCKNIFLSNRQGTRFYLLLLRHNLDFQTAAVSKMLGVSRLSFAKPDKLLDLLKLEPGAVNPLSLIFDQQTQVSLVIDSELTTHERLLFHPGVNHMSLSLASDDFFDVFLPACCHSPVFITIPDN